MKTAIYARKSTNKLGQKETIENQIKICKRYAGEHGLEIVDVKTDSATGTDDLNRPEVKELIEDAIKGKYECVIMKGISRLYRDTEKGLGLIKKLDRSNIRVITVEEMFDSQDNRTGSGKLDTSRITMYLMFSEMESKKLADRIKHTQIEKAHAGEWNHANNTPFGYKYDKETKKLDVDYAKSIIVEKIFDLYLEGKGTKSIAQYLNGDNPENMTYPSPKGKRWSEYTIAFILKNQVYIGNVIYNKRSKKERPYKNPEILGKTADDVYVGNDYNAADKWIITEDAHPAIIGKTTFEEVQRIINTKAKRKGIRNNVSLFAGIAVCKKCGKGMTFKRGRKNTLGQVVTKDNYYCMDYIRYGKQYCTSHHIGAIDLEEAVVDKLIELVNHPELIDKAYNKTVGKIPQENADIEKSAADVGKEIEKVTRSMDAILQKNLEGDIDDNQFKTMNKMYSDKLKKLTDQMEDLKLKLSHATNYDEKLIAFKNTIKKMAQFADMTIEEKRYTLLELIHKVYIDGDEPEFKVFKMELKFEEYLG